MADARLLPVLGFKSQVAACVALADAGNTPEEIAAKIGRDANHVRAALRGRKPAAKPKTFTLPLTVVACLDNEAAARGIDRTELALRLFEMIVGDDLFDALLGEPESEDGRQVADG